MLQAVLLVVRLLGWQGCLATMLLLAWWAGMENAGLLARLHVAAGSILWFAQSLVRWSLQQPILVVPPLPLSLPPCAADPCCCRCGVQAVALTRLMQAKFSGMGIISHPDSALECRNSKVRWEQPGHLHSMAPPSSNAADLVCANYDVSGDACTRLYGTILLKSIAGAFTLSVNHC